MDSSFRSIALMVVLLQTGAFSSGSPRRSLNGDGLAPRDAMAFFETFQGYTPKTQVADQESIDLDQDSIEWQLVQGAFGRAKAIYEQGGHSQSFAQLTLRQPLSSDLKRGTHVSGKNEYGVEVLGKAFGDFEAGDDNILVQYRTDRKELYEPCYIGALPLVGDEETSGCFVENGTVVVDKLGSMDYSYSMLDHNSNGINIAGFSKHAYFNMRKCSDCPYYEDFTQFFDYYGVFDYAHQWVMAALDGRSTPKTFTYGHADFSLLSADGRKEAIKRGTVCLNMFMNILRQFESALDTCGTDCTSADKSCNTKSTRAWDEGVAFYTGSLEGQGEGDGNLMHALADEMCMKYKTCGGEDGAIKGTSKHNTDIFELFSIGQKQLLDGKCKEARSTKDRIAQMMYVPIIQGALSSAYSAEKLNGGEKAQGAGAAFAAAILPKLHACSVDAAAKVHETMRVGAIYSSKSFASVKSAFEANYECMGISCADIGGLFNMKENSFYEGASECQGQETADVNEEPSDASKNAAGIAVGSIVGALTAMCCCFCYLGILRQRQATQSLYSSGKSGENEASSSVYEETSKIINLDIDVEEDCVYPESSRVGEIS